jgi:hypothetical protein
MSTLPPRARTLASKMPLSETRLTALRIEVQSASLFPVGDDKEPEVIFVSDYMNHVIASLESTKENAKKRMSRLETDFMVMAAIHGFTALAPPHADVAETARANHMRAGWLAASLVGVTTLAGLSTVALNNWLPAFVFFVLALAAGWTLRVICDKAVLVILHADPTHPESLQRIRTILVLSSVAVASSFAVFCWLRFEEDIVVLSLISLLAVLFEGGLFAMTAAFHAGEIVNGWSQKMGNEYERVRAEHDKTEHLINAYRSQLTNLRNQSDRDTKSEGGQHEIDSNCFPGVNGHGRVVTNKPNGLESVV